MEYSAIVVNGKVLNASLLYSTYLFENLQITVKHKFYLGSSLRKFTEIPGIHLQWGPNTAKGSTSIIAFAKKHLYQKHISNYNGPIVF